MSQFNWPSRVAMCAICVSVLSIAAVGEPIKTFAPQPALAAARHRLAAAMRRKAFGDRLVHRNDVVQSERRETAPPAAPVRAADPEIVAHHNNGRATARRRGDPRLAALARGVGRTGRRRFRIARLPVRKRRPAIAAAARSLAIGDETRVALSDLGPSAREGRRIWVRIVGPGGGDAGSSAVWLGGTPTGAATSNPLNCWGQPVLFVRHSGQQWSRSMVCDGPPPDTNEWASQIFYQGPVATR